MYKTYNNTSELTSPWTIQTKLMSHPSAAWTQFFSTVISGGADDIKQSDIILVFGIKNIVVTSKIKSKEWYKNKDKVWMQKKGEDYT